MKTTTKNKIKRNILIGILYITFIGNILLLLLAIDVLGFLMWANSGQIPQDNFFIGTITNTFINNFIEIYEATN